MSENSEKIEGAEPTAADETAAPVTDDVEGHAVEEYEPEGVICGVYDRV